MWFTSALGLLGKIGPAITGINFGAVEDAAKGVGASMIKYWYAWVIGLLLAFNLFTGYELKHTRDNLTKEVAAHVKDIQDFKNVQATADANALTIRNALAKESKASADQADTNYSSLLAKYRTNLLRFESGQSGTNQPNSNQLSTSQGGDGPSASSEFPKGLNVSGEDAEICTVNTARLQAVHDWAIGLPKDVVSK